MKIYIIKISLICRISDIVLIKIAQQQKLKNKTNILLDKKKR